VNVRRAAALFVLAGAGGVLAPGPARADPPRLESFGFWNLARLGATGPVRLTPAARVRRFTFILPEGARQGAGSWYLVRLDFRLVLQRRSGNGVVYVEANTRGHAGGLVEFRVHRKRGAPELTWNAIGIVDGIQTGRTRSRSVTVRFRNYVQERGIAAGLNTLSFDYQELGEARVERVELLPSSGIEFTDRSPALVRFGIPTLTKEVHVGDRVRIPFALRNDGDRPVGAVRVRVEYPGNDLRLIGPAERSYPTVEKGIHGTFEFKALHAGHHVLGIFASTRSNHPGAEVQLDVAPRPVGRPLWAWALIVVGVGGVAGLGAHGLLRSRSG
jgi:hypothetical protein